MQHILKSFLKRLTNLSGTNRSLLLLKLSKEQDIDLQAIGFHNGFSSFEIIRNLVEGKKKITLGSITDSRSGNVNEISRQLKKIERRDHLIFEERGARELYIGWPFVRGKLMDETAVRCPLLFFPVMLEQENDKWILKVREGEEISFNKNFLLAYSSFNKVPVSDELADTGFEDWEGDITNFRTNLYNLLAESVIKVNFNQELFIDTISSFVNFTRDEFDTTYKTGELKLFPEAVLGIFPQAGSYLVPDYEELLENPVFADLEDFFTSRTLLQEKPESGNQRFLNRVKEEQIITPFTMDASQENALKAVKTGNSLVVQGPPGTGKSQLISNLIADYIARGKKILLVCQKRAALDVVFNRLKEKDLGDFVGLVHDFRNDRQAIYNQVNKQIERLEEYKTANSSLDSLYLERVFLSSSRQIDQITAELEEFKSALFDIRECGVSIKELYLTSSPQLPSLELGNLYKYFLPADLPVVSTKFKNWLYYAGKFNTPEYPWYGRKSFAGLSITDEKKIAELCDEVAFSKQTLESRQLGLIKKPLDLDQLLGLTEQENVVEQLLTILADPKVYRFFKDILTRNVSEKELQQLQHEILSVFEKGNPESTLQLENLQEAFQLIQKTADLRNSGVQWFFWKLFSKDKSSVQNLTDSNNLELTREGFAELTKRLKLRIALESKLKTARALAWAFDFPAGLGIEQFRQWFEHMQAALNAKKLYLQLKPLKDKIETATLEFPEFSNIILQLVKTGKEYLQARRSWEIYLTPEQITILQNNPLSSTAFKETLKKDFDELAEFDNLQHSLLPAEREVMEKIFSTEPGASADYLLNLFTNSIKLQWIGHIELKYPVLRSVSGRKMDQQEEQLIQAVAEKLKVSREIAVLRARERTYKYIDYNRLNNMVTYRDLKHQVSKKRKVWPLRKLIATFHEELFELVPCWMASPESVSAVFPMSKLFDLVIFDEASQCFSEKGIPAMYRGQQVVITGDEMQLSPSDLYSSRYEDENDDTPELEADSLLSLAGKYLMQVQLTGHYRSRSLELIQFSNEHFYGNNLQLLPDFNHVLQNEIPIKYIKTEGIWEKNVNLAEAEKVADLVAGLVRQKPDETIGVVCFNFNQATLIQDILEEKFTALNIPIPDSLFVKNIENVQGDERDHIIFSIGYAPDKNGRMVMNFGSLNLPKGENRLNVAVTRARNSVHVVSSILPQQLNTENSMHAGPKLLKKYLQYAWEVSEGKFMASSKKSSAYSADWLLKNKLRSNAGLENRTDLQEELPYADLTVKRQSNYKGLILTDDNLYLQGISVKDAHAYLPFSMNNKNWKFKRVYSRQFWQNQDQVKEQIEKHFSE